MLKLTCGITLSVDIGDFFKLKRTFICNWKVFPSTNEQKVLRFVELLSYRSHTFDVAKHSLCLNCNSRRL